MDYGQFIRNIPDFPKPGIQFKDLTPLWADAAAFSSCIKDLSDFCRPLKPDYIIGAESRGFIMGSPLAVSLGCGFVPVRKAGKLPCKTVAQSYSLEYGSATVEISADAFKPGSRVIIADDLLATGGTANAIEALVKKQGGAVLSHVFLVELDFLNGRKALKAPVHSLVHY